MTKSITTVKKLREMLKEYDDSAIIRVMVDDPVSEEFDSSSIFIFSDTKLSITQEEHMGRKGAVTIYGDLSHTMEA